MDSSQNRLLKLIQDKHGVDKHPILVMADIAFDENVDTKIKLDAAKSIMPYIESQRKAIDIKGDLNPGTGLLRVSIVEDGKVEDE